MIIMLKVPNNDETHLFARNGVTRCNVNKQ